MVEATVRAARASGLWRDSETAEAVSDVEFRPTKFSVGTGAQRRLTAFLAGTAANATVKTYRVWFWLA
jgi:hypothetical protein